MLSKTAEYALRAAVRMAKLPYERHSADSLAEATQVPRRYLHKVVQDLARAGLVRSQSGPGVGYALALRPEPITILDVINAVAPVKEYVTALLAYLPTNDFVRCLRNSIAYMPMLRRL